MDAHVGAIEGPTAVRAGGLETLKREIVPTSFFRAPEEVLP
jgi:hypothetical protein